MNSTFAGTYGLYTTGQLEEFPFRGEFDPRGITVGWVVSYWNEYKNYHSLGAWTGYARKDPHTYKSVLSMSRMIAHEENHNTTSGYGTFVLLSDN